MSRRCGKLATNHLVLFGKPSDATKATPTEDISTGNKSPNQPKFSTGGSPIESNEVPAEWISCSSQCIQMIFNSMETSYPLWIGISEHEQAEPVLNGGECFPGKCVVCVCVCLCGHEWARCNVGERRRLLAQPTINNICAVIMCGEENFQRQR